MNLTQLTSSALKQIAALLEKKESLQAQIADIDHALIKLQGGKRLGTLGRISVAGRRGGLTTPRGQLRDRILAELKSAGKEGISVKELAAKLNHKDRNVYAWFMQTGKKIKSIRNLGSGRFRWQD